ncbi:hypothetical protein PVAP13_8KG080484 [Panicum virgatum]|uniref:Reverse transcriptase zinc-binding domain-containing protein n=1 Tax=Panicum virgatum TaxID=38727 RepID=A0A8T0PI69_PANVG|nr:hypothetical protein PVAP13_8KG080484 [Panicum virgatum]
MADHLILQCCFAKEVWHLASLWTQDLVKMPTEGLPIAAWWEQELAGLPKKLRRTKASLMMYTAWNLWKERNRHSFEHTSSDTVRVLQDIKVEVSVQKLACGGLVIPFLS